VRSAAVGRRTSVFSEAEEALTVLSMPAHRSRARGWVPAAAALAACGVLAACGSSAGSSDGTSSAASGGTASSPQTITLYSGQHPQTTQALVKAFEQESGITVKVRSDDEDPLADQIMTEGSRSPADVFFTENTPPLEARQAKGLLSPVRPSTLAC
jgi:iron(III) transport system substrate-binding protein